VERQPAVEVTRAVDPGQHVEHRIEARPARRGAKVVCMNAQVAAVLSELANEMLEGIARRFKEVEVLAQHGLR
jgi:hypothetical protein